jgi:hypothetical protein
VSIPIGFSSITSVSLDEIDEAVLEAHLEASALEVVAKSMVR